MAPSRRPARSASQTPARALHELVSIRAEFGGDAAARKLALLARLAGARLATARDVLRFHDTLVFLRAHPDDRAVLARVEALLAGFAERADLRRHAAALASSGIAGTTIHYRFFDPMAQWLAARWPERLHVDWPDFESGDRLLHVLPRFAAFAESPALDELELTPRAWVDRLRGNASDGAFLAAGFRRAFADELARETAWDELDPPLRLEPGPGTPARGAEVVTWAPRRFQTAPLARPRPDLVAESARPPLAIRDVPRRRAERIVDLARCCMVTRSRDLDAFAHGDPGDVRLADHGEGLAFAVIGVRPARRLLLESVYGFLTLRNGVPVGYVLCSGLWNSAEVMFNVFETWRGGEAAWIFGRALATVRALLGADSFAVDPYQLGHGNDEALGSGAWWFYQKLGFRPRDRGALALMGAELARIGRRPAHRSSAATLARLARHPVWFASGPPREDVLGRIPLAAIGSAVTRHLAARFGADRDRAETVCAAELGERLGTDAPRGWRPGEALAWRRWAPLLTTLPRIEDWSAAERAAVVEVVRAKGGARESEFAARFDAHPRLRRAVLDLSRTPPG